MASRKGHPYHHTHRDWNSLPLAMLFISFACTTTTTLATNLQKNIRNQRTPPITNGFPAVTSQGSSYSWNPPFITYGFPQFNSQDALVSPCTTLPDQTYGGNILACSNKNIKHFQPSWVPSNTTTIMLNDNGVSYFQAETFLNASGLRYFDISRNRFRYLAGYWFHGMTSLRVLLASGNSIGLGQKSFTENVFQYLPSLTFLDLGSNFNIDVNDEYPDFLLQDLSILEQLTLDTFASDLDFGSVFDNITTLKSLTLTGGARRIKNDTFKSFYGIHLETLRLQHLDLLLDTEINAFEPLVFLKNFYASHVMQQMNVTLLSLRPFEGRHLHNINFYYLGKTLRDMSAFEGSNIITAYTGQYLRNICIDNFVVVHCDLFAFDLHALLGSSFAKCLKTVRSKFNHLYGDVTAYFEMVRLKELKSLSLTRVDTTPEILPMCTSGSALSNIEEESKVKGHRQNIKTTRLMVNTILKNNLHNTPPSKDSSRLSVNGNPRKADGKDDWTNTRQINTSALKCTDLYIVLSTGSSNRTSVMNSLEKRLSSDSFSSRRTVCIRLPPNLQYLSINEMVKIFIQLDFALVFWPNNLKECIVTGNHVQFMSGQVAGLDRLELLDISNNNANRIKWYFFDYFTSLKILLTRKMNFDLEFMALSSSRLYSRLTNMETIDLTNNDLNLLSPDTFKTNNKLKVIILARNRFKSIPFAIEHTPDLCLLNLTYNSISVLSETEMNQLDDQARKTGGYFSLLLEGNVMSCGCSQIKFMQWLQSTPVNLDWDGNYSCISEDGTLRNTSDFRELESFWRQCSGKSFLLTSLVVLALQCMGLTIALLVYHFKTRLTGYIHQVILRKIQPQTPWDYSTGVCLEYGDTEATWVCLTLRKFIEEELDLTTFVRHRDLLANDYRDASISREIQNSWRVLLVITESYLTSDLWSFYTMKVASHSASLTNQSKIVLLVEAGLEKKIPFWLLKTTQEGSVIRMETKPPQLNDVMKERLRKALCYLPYDD